MSLYADGAWRGRRPGRSGGFNQSGNSFQANPNKSKQKSLDLFGFIRPNRDFSMGYEQKIKKRLASQVVCKTSQLDLTISFSSVFSPLRQRRDFPIPALERA